jgi:SPP1 family phage portal protein
MENLLDRLKTEPEKVVETIRAKTKSRENIDNYQKEFYQNDRTLRDMQVGKVQKDKNVGTGASLKLVKAVRIPIKFAKKIVTTATAFEVGKPVTIVPSEENNLSKLISQLWKVNRIDSKIQKLITLKKSETQAAMQFYIADLASESLLNRLLIKIGLKAQAKEIKCNVLDNTSGIMTPYFDSTGNMIAFMWEYKGFDEVTEKDLNHVKIWDKDNFHYLNNANGTLAYQSNPTAHGFDRIPIVYVDQLEPEWFDVKEMIDRYEVAVSKLGASVDYSAYPLLQVFGEIASMPDKDDAGKILRFPITVDETGKQHHGKAEFLSANDAIESAKYELENLKNLIYSISHTPDLSFDNVKGLGNVSAVALKLLFLDAVIKARMNEGDNRTMIERILNIITSGITKTTNTALGSESQQLIFDIIFNSIVPDDVQSATDIIIKLKEAKLLSSETALKLIDLVEDPEQEMELIKAENQVEPIQPLD